ncbi:MAG: DNA polymerase IV [Alphaproteobacteria bacterium]|nr:DNA polymerase IV [Alphaproteobacteria bacterium]
MAAVTGLCRDCGRLGDGQGPCPACGSSRSIRHPELTTLSIGHIDCDAFYASIEKRDDPALRDRPVIVGGGRRGVVAAACYIARRHGVHAAMPMFKALRACPEAVVIPPDMAKYQAVGRGVREILLSATPEVEPVSIDEAFVDLRGTERLHARPPAATLAHLANRIEGELGVTVSIGLSYNKFLAKIASDLDKPRGFAVIGRTEAKTFLADRPVGLLPGVGPALARRLAGDGIIHIGQLAALDAKRLSVSYGNIAPSLVGFAHCEDARPVEPHRPTVSVSAETTFAVDIRDRPALERELWPLAERVAQRLKAKGLAGTGITLKLKTAQFQLRARSATLGEPTQLAEIIFRSALPLLAPEATGTAFRLIGVAMSGLRSGAAAGPGNLFDPERERWARVERAIDTVRAKLGPDAIRKGRGFVTGPQQPGGRGSGSARSKT